MRHLVSRGGHRPLADKLRRKKAFRLIRNLIRGEKRRPLRQMRDHRGERVFDSFASQSADRHDGREIAGPADLLHQREQFCLLHAIHFVEQDDSHRIESCDFLERELRAPSQVFARVEHQRDDIHRVERRFNFVNHLAAENRIRPMQPGRVNENHLRAGAIHDPLNSIARGLRMRRDDRNLLRDEPIDQRGLAGIRTADDRNKSGLEGRFHAAGGRASSIAHATRASYLTPGRAAAHPAKRLRGGGP